MHTHTHTVSLSTDTTHAQAEDLPATPETIIRAVRRLFQKNPTTPELIRTSLAQRIYRKIEAAPSRTKGSNLLHGQARLMTARENLDAMREKQRVKEQKMKEKDEADAKLEAREKPVRDVLHRHGYCTTKKMVCDDMRVFMRGNDIKPIPATRAEQVDVLLKSIRDNPQTTWRHRQDLCRPTKRKKEDGTTREGNGVKSAKGPESATKQVERKKRKKSNDEEAPLTIKQKTEELMEAVPDVANELKRTAEDNIHRLHAMYTRTKPGEHD